MRFPTVRIPLLLSFLLATPAFAEESAPRLVSLSPPLAADFAEERQITPIAQYGQTWVRQLQLKAGSQIPAHSAPTRALVIVLQGQGQFDFSGEIVSLNPHQMLHMQPGERHAVIAETDLELLVIRLPAED